ncbi:class I SAM-dependent methyltransferase [Methylocystis sp.]|uniref:class I SAM-dependent methyltransferase n=1 Tax=Methylocystis sp. TaxID=1911079 RepID=UPI003DA2526B
MLYREAFPIPRRPTESSCWPQSWRDSYHYDRLEVWEERHRPDSLSAGYVLSYESRRRQTLKSILLACPPPARVLDLASAQGNFAIALAGLGYEVTWNDLRAELADYVRLKLPDGMDLEFAAGNIFDLGGAHLGRYDVVLAAEVIEHVAHPNDFIAKLVTLLRPGGAVVLSTPNGGYFLNRLPRFSDCPDPSVHEHAQFKPNADGHIFLIHEDELRCWARGANLDVDRFDLITNPLTAGHIKLRYLLRVLPQAAVRAIEALSRALPRPLRRRLAAHAVAVLRKPWHARRSD